MKNLFFILVSLSLSLTAFADQKSSLIKVNANTATMKIVTEDKESVQAAMFVDGEEVSAFIDMMLKDKNSELAKAKAKIEMKMCNELSTPENPRIDSCGEVVMTPNVQTYFNRGGWAEGEAEYTFFVGFHFDGTGRMRSMNYMATIYEGAAADTKNDYEYAGSVTKTYRLVKIIPFPKK